MKICVVCGTRHSRRYKTCCVPCGIVWRKSQDKSQYLREWKLRRVRQRLVQALSAVVRRHLR